MKQNVLWIAMAAGLMLTSCASKKDLVNCQTENKSLTESLQATKEDPVYPSSGRGEIEERFIEHGPDEQSDPFALEGGTEGG